MKLLLPSNDQPDTQKCIKTGLSHDNVLVTVLHLQNSLNCSSILMLTNIRPTVPESLCHITTTRSLNRLKFNTWCNKLQCIQSHFKNFSGSCTRPQIKTSRRSTPISTGLALSCSNSFNHS